MGQHDEEERRRKAAKKLSEQSNYERGRSKEQWNSQADKARNAYETFRSQGDELSQTGSTAETEEELLSCADELRSMAEKMDPGAEQLNSLAEKYEVLSEVEEAEFDGLNLEDHNAWSLTGSDLAEDFEKTREQKRETVEAYKKSAEELRAQAQEIQGEKSQLLSQAEELSEKARDIETSPDVDPDELEALDKEWEEEARQYDASSSTDTSQRFFDSKPDRPNEGPGDSSEEEHRPPGPGSSSS